MDEIETRARELLAAEYMLSLNRAGPKQRHLHACAIRAIITALTPPYGFVLVPVEPTEKMLRAHAGVPFDGRTVRERYQRMIAARPEIPNE